MSDDPEFRELQKLIDLYDLDIPQSRLNQIANNIGSARRHAEAQRKLLQQDVLNWIEAASELAEHVDLETKLTSDNELIRKMAKQDFDLDEKMRWKMSLR